MVIELIITDRVPLLQGSSIGSGDGAWWCMMVVVAAAVVAAAVAAAAAVMVANVAVVMVVVITAVMVSWSPSTTDPLTSSWQYMSWPLKI